MNKIYKPLAILGLLLTIIPPLLLFFGAGIGLTATKTTMFVGMILWFTGATPWLAFQKEELDTSTQDQI